MNQQGRIIHRSANHPDLEPKDEAPAELAAARTRGPMPPTPPEGLGDLVYKAAHPIGCGLDRLTKRLPKRFRTRLCTCTACSKRRQWMNRHVPNWRAWKGGWQVVCKAIADWVQRAFRRG